MAQDGLFVCVYLFVPFGDLPNLWKLDWIVNFIRRWESFTSISVGLCLFLSHSRFSQWDLPVSDGNDLCLLFAPLDITFFFAAVVVVDDDTLAGAAAAIAANDVYHQITSIQLTRSVCIMYISNSENDCNTYLFLNRIQKGI